MNGSIYLMKLDDLVNKVNEYFENHGLEKGEFQFNFDQTVATLILPMNGVASRKEANKFTINISLQRTGQSKIFLSGCKEGQGVTEYEFSNISNFFTNMIKLLPLESTTNKSKVGVKAFDLNDLIEALRIYLGNNKITYTGLKIEDDNKRALLEVPSSKILKDKDFKYFCIDINESDDKKIMILTEGDVIIDERNFETIEEFIELIKYTIPLKTKKIDNMYELGFKIDKIERKIDSILEILKKRDG